MSSKQQTHHREWNIDCKVYIGNLSEGASKLDVENSFGKFGPLKNVWVARNPPGFAFVEYEDARDAEDAVRGLDGTKIAGARVRVEMSHGRQRRDRDGGGDRRGGGGRGFRGGGGGDYRNGGGRDYGRDVDRDRGGRRGGSRGDDRGTRRFRSRSRSPPPRRAAVPRYSRSRSRSPRAASRSMSRSPVRRGSPPPRSARTPPSRSRSPSPRQ